MIAVVWVVLAGCFCGGLYAAARILAREDMPPTDVPGSEREYELGSRTPAMTCPALGSGGGGSARSSSPVGQPTTYQVLYAMASAVNEAWLDRLFSESGAHRV